MSIKCWKQTLLITLLNVWLSQSELNECSSNDGSLINTNYGCIRGRITDMGRSFTSIPYATPPTPENDLRFRNPQEPEHWRPHILNVTTIAPQCMTSDCDARNVDCYKSTEAIMSEDCLYLNVYTPSMDYISTQNNTLPVLFWIHGGAYTSGWSGSSLYNPQTIAHLNNVIVVTINYRLGSFGFFYDPPNGFDGNYGYFDQLLALQFVHENIEYFGGDNLKVVLFGESVGAASVTTLLMNASNTMYSGAILQSTPFGVPLRTTDSWQNVPFVYVENAGCNNHMSLTVENCMRTVTAQQLLGAQNSIQSSIVANCKSFNCYWVSFLFPWTPTFQTEAFPQTQALFALQNGEYNSKVPIIIGSNKDEGVLFAYPLIAAITGSEEDLLSRKYYKSLLYATMGIKYGNKIIEQYKQYEPECLIALRCDYRPVLSKVLGDLWFICGAKNASDSMSKHSNVWKYQYNHLYTYSSDLFGTLEFCSGLDNNVCHGNELPIVFQPPTFRFTQEERELSSLIQQYWSNLARLQRPESTGQTFEWEKYNEMSEWTMVFTNEGGNEMQMHYEEINNIDCDFFDNLGWPQLFFNDADIELFAQHDYTAVYDPLFDDNHLNADWMSIIVISCITSIITMLLVYVCVLTLKIVKHSPHPLKI